MAQIGSLGTFRGYTNSDSTYGGYYVYFTYDASGVTVSNMKVYLSKIDQTGPYTTNTAYLDSVKVGGTAFSYSPSEVKMYNGGAVKTLTYTLSGSKTASGTSLSVEIKMHRSGQSASAQTFSGTITGLATAPTGLSCSVSSIYENYANVSGSYTSNGGASVTASGLQYSTNNSTWSVYTSGSGGTALSPNTKYYFRYYATNVAGTSYSSSVEKTTYQYPYVSAVGTSALTIGNSQTLTLYNPLGRNCSVYMKKDSTSGTTLYSGTTTGTSIQFTPTASTLYSSIPSATSGNAVYYCTYSSQTIGTKSGTYKIKGDEKPTFTSSNFNYSTDFEELTGDTNTIIKGITTATFNITSAGTSSYGATITKYVLIWNGVSNVERTSIGTMNITGGNNATITLRCYDSRNLYKDVAITFNFANYISPTITGSTKRNNGVGEDVLISLNGNIFYNKFGPNGITNDISSIGYRCSTTQSFTGLFHPVNATINYGSASGNQRSWNIKNFRIYYDGYNQNFNFGTKYYVQVYIEDANGNFAISETILTITDGNIAKDVYKDDNNQYHIGLNGIARSNYNVNIEGTQNISGDSYIKDTKIEKYIADYLYPYNSIYMSLTNQAPSHLVGVWQYLNSITSNGTTYYVYKRIVDKENVCVNNENLLYNGEEIIMQISS